MGKELLTNRDHLGHLDFLATKLRILGEYLTVMEAGEMIGDNRNDYQDIGETIYQLSSDITETLEKMREIRRAA
jgi:hypothetical protein